ncbi:MAG: FAD-binding domain-containing protein [Acidobacteriota bacterium]
MSSSRPLPLSAPSSGGLQVVWLKRDLRLHDHQPLAEAARRGPVLPLFVYEPDLLASAEFDPSHFTCLRTSLRELAAGFEQRGARLAFRVGEVTEVLEAIHRRQPIAALWSHQETGNDLTYRRDRQVGRWARERGVPWHQPRQHGIVRALKDRDGWAKQWNQLMARPLVPVPPRFLGAQELPAFADFDFEGPREAGELGIGPDTKDLAWAGGEAAGREVLESFLAHRGVDYRKAMSSPVTAADACSRLSHHLAFGTISLREVYQRARDHREELKQRRKAGESIDPRWVPSISSFLSRLRWHCHFMQKLEDEPQLEFHNLCRAYDGLREGDFRQDRFDAWCAGETGYPMVDACMKALHRGGWINFRMRAMLASFAAYHLWLHWRPTSVYLARHFLDFEPGIHFSQFQMQSGVTGINSIRVYSPAKQVLDQDPEGVFIRRWLPALESVPKAYLSEPHRMPEELQRKVGCVIGKDYPAPLVDHRQAVSEAKSKIYARRRQPETRAAAEEVYRRHGSRRRPPQRGRRAQSAKSSAKSSADRPALQPARDEKQLTLPTA